MDKYKKFIKIMLISALIFIVGIYGAFHLILSNISVGSGGEGYPEPGDTINILTIGVAKGLSDTIMLCSLDTQTNELNVYSIPRDTYYPRKGHNSAAAKKINASYGNGGADSVVKSVQDLTGVPIHYYVQVDYDTVIAIVDALGGLPVEVPQDMDYDDPADDLSIHFKKGEVVKKGEDIIKLLRWRKNNKGGGYAEGDLGRIKMQQHIVELGMQKLKKGNVLLNFFRAQGAVSKYVRTNMTPKQMMVYALKANKIKKDSISMQTIPGSTKTIEGLSFFVPNKEKMKELFSEINN